LVDGFTVTSKASVPGVDEASASLAGSCLDLVVHTPTVVADTRNESVEFMAAFAEHAAADHGYEHLSSLRNTDPDPRRDTVDSIYFGEHPEVQDPPPQEDNPVRGEQNPGNGSFELWAEVPLGTMFSPGRQLLGAYVSDRDEDGEDDVTVYFVDGGNFILFSAHPGKVFEIPPPPPPPPPF
jgi:hypothetical protein